MAFIKLSLAIFVISFLAWSADIQFEEVGSLSQMELELNLTPEEATPKAIKAEGKTFYRIPIHQEGFYFGREGKPELPLLHRWLAVSSNSQYRIEVLPGSYKVYKNILLYPAQPDSVEGTQPPFKLSKRAYRANRWYGKRRASLGKRAILGTATILPISFSPVEYNPVLKELHVFENIRVRLINISSKPIDEPTEISQYSAQQIAHLTLNGESFLKSLAKTSRVKKILIAYGTGMDEWIKEFSSVYQDQGFNAIPVEVPSNIKPESLKNILSTEHKKLNVDAIMILGDETAVPMRDFNGKLGDFSYSLLSGTDQIADVALGRYPIKNQTQAKTILNKLKKYRELQNQGYKNHRVMLIAHAQDYPGKYTQNMEAVKSSANPLGLEFSTQYGGEKAKNSTVIEEAQKGYAIINYRGHGSASSWTGWGSDGASFSTSQVKELPMDDKSMSFIFNVACTNGAIQNASPALVERELFPNDNPESFQGAIGTFGATAPSLTEVNHRFNLNLFKFLQVSPGTSVGNIYTLANNQLTKDNGGSSTSNTRMYVLFSDPLLAPWVNSVQSSQD